MPRPPAAAAPAAPRWRPPTLALALAGVAGLAAGYAAEDGLLHPRLLGAPREGPPLGSLAGEVGVVDGPRGVKLHTETFGPRRAGVDMPTVVLVHGFCLTGRTWHEQVVALRETHRLVTYDQPAHGRSSAPDPLAFDVDLFGDGLAAVLEAETDGPVVVVGHSLGAMTVTNMLRRHPALRQRVGAALLLAGASSATASGMRLGMGFHWLARLEQASGLWGRFRSAFIRRGGYAYRRPSDLSYLVHRELGFGRNPDPNHVRFMERLLLANDLETIDRVVDAIFALDEDAALGCLPRPTVMAVGTRDRIVPAGHQRRMAARCLWVEQILVPEAGHALHLEAAADINRLIVELAGRGLAEGA